MTQKERCNFYRFSTRIVDHTKEVFIDLIDLSLVKKHLSFEDFINLNQHEIYHFCYNRGRCCQCTPGYTLPQNRILHPSQLEILLDKNGATLPCHRANRVKDYCCCKAIPGVSTLVLDVTLARFILINFCEDIFWYSSLTYPNLSLEDFLNNHKHELYHMYTRNTPCCLCPTGYVFPVKSPVLNQQQWTTLFSVVKSPCMMHMNVTSTNLVCSVAATIGITVNNLDKSLERIILENICSVRKAIGDLIHMRNNIYGHATEVRISDADYNCYSCKLDDALLEIAKICGKEANMRQKLNDVELRPLDETLLLQYQTKLLEQKQCFDSTNEEISARFDYLESKVQKIENLPEENEKRKQHYTEITEATVHACANEGTFVFTNTVTDAMDNLLKFGIALITGHPGTGKTRMGLELLHRYSTRFRNYRCIQLQNLSDWLDVLSIEDKYIVFLDDVFGKTNFIYSENTDNKHMDTILTYVQNGQVKVIITMRENIKHMCNRLFLSHRLFKNIPDFNLGSDTFGMNKNEKRRCLLNYFERNNIEETEEAGKENCLQTSCLNQSETIYIHTKTINNIVDMKFSPLIGFPESCYLFTSNRRFTRQGLSFFKHANEILCQDIADIREQGYTCYDARMDYTVLVYVLVRGDYLSLKYLDLDLPVIRRLMTSFYATRETPIGLHDVEDSVKRLTPNFLKTKYDHTPDVFAFQHRTIFEAVILSCHTIDPDLMIEFMDVDFIIEFTRPQNYNKVEGEVVYTIPETLYKLLAQRMISHLTHGSTYSQVYSDDVILYKPFTFVKMICTSLIIRLTGTEILGHMCEEYMRKKGNLTLEWCDIQYMEIPQYNSQCYKSELSWNYFNLPVAFLMFCENTDDVLLYLQSVINDILKSKREAYSYLQCKMAIREAFIFSCLHMDKRKMTILWQIIKAHDISIFQAEDFLDNEIVDGVRILLHNKHLLTLLSDTIDDPALFELLNVFKGEVMYLYGEDRDEKTICLLKKFDSDYTYDVQIAIKDACCRKELSLLQFLLENFYQDYFDFNSAIKCVPCRLNDGDDSLVNVVQLFMEKFGETMISRDIVMEVAITRGNKSLVKYLLSRFDKRLFDIQSAMRKSRHCRPGFFLFLIETFDQDQIDMKFAMTLGCSTGDIDLVQSLIYRYDIGLFDWQDALEAACQNQYRYTCNIKLIKLLLEINKTDCLDVKSIMDMACLNGSEKIVVFLLDTFDHKTFNIRSAVNMACRSGRLDKIQVFLDRFDNALIDIKSAFYQVCRHGSLNAVKYVLKKIDSDILNTCINDAICHACWCSNVPVTMYLLETVAHNLLDINSLLVNACHSGEIETVTLLVDIFDHKLFNVNMIIQQACLSSSVQMVKYLLQKLSLQDIDLTLAVNMSCLSGSRELVNFWLKTVDHNSIHIKSAVNMAFLSGNLECVESLLRINQFKDYDLPKALNMACLSGKVEVVKFLLEKFSIQSFDMQSAMNKACLSRSADVVRVFIGKFDHKLFNLKTAMNMACQIWNIKAVKYLLKMFNSNTFDMKSAMNTACFYGNAKVVTYFINKLDPRHYRFDLKEALNNACRAVCYEDLLADFPPNHCESCQKCDMENGKTDVVHYFLNSFDHSIFDVEQAFNNACGTGILQLVHLFVTSVDHNQLDVTSAVNKSCAAGNADTVKLLHSKFGPSVFDVKTALRKARRGKNRTIITFLENIKSAQSSGRKSRCTVT